MVRLADDHLVCSCHFSRLRKQNAMIYGYMHTGGDISFATRHEQKSQTGASMAKGISDTIRLGNVSILIPLNQLSYPT